MADITAPPSETQLKSLLRALDDLDLPALTALLRPLSAIQVVDVLERLDVH